MDFEAGAVCAISKTLLLNYQVDGITFTVVSDTTPV